MIIHDPEAVWNRKQRCHDAIKARTYIQRGDEEIDVCIGGDVTSYPGRMIVDVYEFATDDNGTEWPLTDDEIQGAAEELSEAAGRLEREYREDDGQ